MSDSTSATASSTAAATGALSPMRPSSGPEGGRLASDHDDRIELAAERPGEAEHAHGIHGVSVEISGFGGRPEVGRIGLDHEQRARAPRPGAGVDQNRVIRAGHQCIGQVDSPGSRSRRPSPRRAGCGPPGAGRPRRRTRRRRGRCCRCRRPGLTRSRAAAPGHRSGRTSSSSGAKKKRCPGWRIMPRWAPGSSSSTTEIR